MTLADGSEDGPHGAPEYKHLHEECLVLFSAEQLYTAAFFCQRPHPVLHASQGTSSHPGRPMRSPEIKFRVRGSHLLTESFGRFIMGKSGVILNFMLAPVGFTNMTVEILSGD